MLAKIETQLKVLVNKHGLKPYRKNGLKNFSKQSVMIFKNDIRRAILYTYDIYTYTRKKT